MTPGPDSAYFRALDATWPPARWLREGPFTLREGLGGGNRVSSASQEGPFDAADLDRAEAAMRALGQPSQFMIRSSDGDLDAALARRSYRVAWPVTLYAAPVAALTALPPPCATFVTERPLAVMESIWAEGGIGPARLRVMARAVDPKTYLFGRLRDLPAGTAFAAAQGGIAMIHAIEVSPAARRGGVGRSLLIRAAEWAAGIGAEVLALAVTRDNAPANALYASLGMGVVEQYHYRIEPGPPRR